MKTPCNVEQLCPSSPQFISLSSSPLFKRAVTNSRFHFHVDSFSREKTVHLFQIMVSSTSAINNLERYVLRFSGGVYIISEDGKYIYIYTLFPWGMTLS